MKIYILCADPLKGLYAHKDYEFSHSLSSGERKGNSLNQSLWLVLQGFNVGSTSLNNLLFNEVFAEGEHLGRLLKEALWKEAP